MKITPTQSRRSRLVFGAALLGLMSVATYSLAQDSEEDDDVFTLSPFTVDASGDSGYRSENTLAGTRLNSSLKDTAAAISVFNKEFLNDIAAVDDIEALNYAINAEGQFEQGRAAATGANQMLEFAHNFQIRGLPASRGRNFFNWELSMDSYNTERFDESRGPNSVLFGLGAPGGIFNTSTKRASLGRDFGQLEFQLGSHDLVRGTIDVNRVLVDDKLAVRFNAMESDENGYRFNTYKEKWARHIAFTLNPAEWVTVMAEYEKGDTLDNRARHETALDEFTTWHNTGTVVQDTSGLTNPASNPDRATLLGSRDRSLGIWWNTQDRLVYIDNSGEAFNSRNYLLTDTQGAQNQAFVFEEGFLDPRMNMTGPHAQREMPFETYSAIFQLNPMENLHVEVAYNHLDSFFENYDPTNAGQRIYANPNSHYLLLDGSETDEFGGLYYSEVNWVIRSRDQSIDNFRVSGSYEFELGEKLGRHQLAFLYENIQEDHRRREFRELLEEPLFHNNPEDARNRVYRRKYFNPGEYEEMHVADWDNDPGFVYNGESIGTRWVPSSAGGSFNDEYETTSYMAVLQSFWLNNRVVTTAGYRKDKREIVESGIFRDPDTRVWTIDEVNTSLTEHDPDTATFGMVGHINEKVSFLFNQSTSVTLANTNMRVLPDSLSPEPSDNEGLDVGFNFSLLEDKISLRTTYFESEALGAATYSSGAGGVRNANNRAWDALADAGYVTAELAESNQIDPGAHYFDRNSSGYEVRLMANLAKNWTLMLNFSETDVVETNIMPLLGPYGDALLAEIAALAPGDDGDDSVYSALDFANADGTPIDTSSNSLDLYENFFNPNEMVDDIEFFQAFDGREAYGNRKHKFNTFTRYTFREGRLKGGYVGGGYRWQSGRVNQIDASGNPAYSDDLGLVDLVFGYRTKALGNKTLEFQLNVSNALDDDTFHDLRYNNQNTAVIRGYFENPRTYRFTTRLKF